MVGILFICNRFGRNHIPRGFDDDLDVDESAPSVNSFTPSSGVHSGVVQLNSRAYDPDTVDEDFLEVRYYYHTSEPTDANRDDWTEIGRVEGSEGDDFIIGWDTVNDGFPNADGRFSEELYSSKFICVLGTSRRKPRRIRSLRCG